MAQDQSVETVVVTGSRIPQTGLYSSSPVTVVGQQDSKMRGTTNVEDLLNSMPQVVAGQNNTVSNGASGTADVDLRGLGAVRTLVLVDGKRLMPGDADAVSHATGGVADLNMIPAPLIDHIEVLTGGASSTYGSDAVAGVVNFILRKDFEGVEIDGQYTIAQNDNNKNFPTNFAGGGNILDMNNIPRPQTNIWDGQTEDIHLLMGMNSANGKGNVTVYAGYQHIAPITEDKRDFSACSAGSYTSTAVYTYDYCGGSSTSPEGKFVSVDSGNFNSVNGLQKGDPGYLNPIHYATQAHTLSATSPGLFNYAPFNYLQRPDTRYTAGYEAHYEVSKALDVYSTFMFMDDHTVAQVAPGGAFQTPFSINCDNPLMSAQQEATLCPAGATSIKTGVAFTGNAATDAGNLATVLIGRRSLEAGTRVDDLRHTDYRFLLGAKGDLGNNWSYDVSAQYGVDVYANAQGGYFSGKNMQSALLVAPNGQCEAAIAGTDTSCVPLNIFTAPNLNAARNAVVGASPLTPQQLAYVSTNGLALGQADEYVVTGALTGDLGSIGGQSPWAKSPIGVSVGAEYRQEGIRYTPDQELITGDLMGIGGTRTASHGSYNVKEAFGEVRVPLVQGVPFVEDLTLNGGFRYSSYSSVGPTTTYKYGAEWQPIDDIRFRAGFDHAVRAPNIAELFASQNVVLFGGQDPCANNGSTNAPPTLTPGLIAFCKASGLPNFGSAGSAYGNILPCPASQCNQQTAGNPSLRPEISDTRTLGLVLTPTFFDGFTATVDYYDIKVSKTIGTFGASFILGQCKSDPTSPACSLIHRDPATQFLWTPGGYVENPSSNLGFIRTKGVDFEASYQKDLSDFGLDGYGDVSLHFNGTWLESFVTEPVPPSSIFFSPVANGRFNCAGFYGNQCGTPDPKWHHNLRLTWNTPWSVSGTVTWRHIAAVKVDFNSTNAILAGPDDQIDNINSYDYFDLAAEWDVRDGVSLRAGVNNVFDKGPPINGLAFGNGNTPAGTYDALGRYMFVGGTLKF
jgi:outer membrane receptor protein involved in Fe transport